MISLSLDSGDSYESYLSGIHATYYDITGPSHALCPNTVQTDMILCV
jgi:hypothetical protein